jgi:hypothetical protein
MILCRAFPFLFLVGKGFMVNDLKVDIRGSATARMRSQKKTPLPPFGKGGGWGDFWRKCQEYNANFLLVFRILTP